METTELISWSVLFISIFNLFILILNHLLRKRTTYPTIDVSIYSLPPYDDDETLLVIRNIGTSIAYNISAEIEFSYSEEKIPVDFGKDYILAINEPVKEYLKFPSPQNQKKAYIKILVKFHWKRHFGNENIYTERIYLEELKDSKS